MFSLTTRKKMFRLMCLCAIPLFSLPLAASADNSLLIFHGDYGGGSSTHGVSHVLKYDKVNNVYYVMRQSYGIMNKVSGTAFETQGMKDSTKNLADAISSRKEKLAAETDQRTASDDAIRAKIDRSLVLTYDSNAHDTITLGGEGGTLLSNVKGDESDASSLANGGQLFDVNTAISGEVSAREDAVTQEAGIRSDADAALSARLGTLPENGAYHYVKASGEASMSDNLLSLHQNMVSGGVSIKLGQGGGEARALRRMKMQKAVALSQKALQDAKDKNQWLSAEAAYYGDKDRTLPRRFRMAKLIHYRLSLGDHVDPNLLEEYQDELSYIESHENS